jgi:hypothetical protein
MKALAAGQGGDKQADRVRSLFHRQLQVSTWDLPAEHQQHAGPTSPVTAQHRCTHCKQNAVIG